MKEMDRLLTNPAFRGLDFRESKEGSAFGCRSVKVGSFFCSIFFMETSPIPISSTEIRDKVKNGESIAGLLPQEIEDYIRENGIYRNDQLNG